MVYFQNINCFVFRYSIVFHKAAVQNIYSVYYFKTSSMCIFNAVKHRIYSLGTLNPLQYLGKRSPKYIKDIFSFLRSNTCYNNLLHEIVRP